MIFRWWRNRRRKKLLAREPSALWKETFASLPLTEELEPEESVRLLRLSRVFADEKHFEGCGGLELTERMKMIIAIQACVLILGLEHEYYRKVKTILVYPSGYKRTATTSQGGIITEKPAHVLGEAMLGGPVVLSWRDALAGGRDEDDGRNVVIHEFAHQLDMLDGWIDGTPPLETRSQYDAWREVVGDEFEALVKKSERGGKTLIDFYGATNPAEFFSVSSEVFFERPRRLQKKHEGLYNCLQRFYLQDPAERRRS